MRSNEGNGTRGARVVVSSHVTSDSLTIGITAQSTDRSMPLLDLAAATAERGFAALFVCEHTHMPSNHTSWPPGDEDRFITHLWDPFIALSFVAATTDLAIGTAVALPAQHDPIVLAKEIATLDRLSGGRLTLGFGWGWNREEVANHGYPPQERVAVLTEKLALMKALWTENDVAFDGTYHHMSPSSSHPKPIQKPHPPVLLGVPGTARNFARIAAWADGWIPHASPLLEAGFPAQLDEARGAWQRAGRDPGRFDVTVLQLPETTDRLRHAIDNALTLGVRRLLFVVVEADTTRTLRQLDELAPLLTR
jgi:probable F420-dependent oxidoreductase